MLPVVSIDVHGTPTIGTGAHLPGIGCTGGQAAQGDAGVCTDTGGRGTAAGGGVAVAIVINTATHRLPLQRHRRRLVRCAIGRRRLIEREAQPCHKRIRGAVVRIIIRPYRGGEVGRSRPPRHDDGALPVNRQRAGGVVPRTPTEEGGRLQRGQVAAQLRHKRIIEAAVVRRIIRPCRGGEVGRIRLPRHDDITLPVNRQRCSFIIIRPAEEGGRLQRGQVAAQLRHKRIRGAAVVRRIIRPYRGGEVGRLRPPRHDDVALPVNRQRRGDVPTRPAEEGGRLQRAQVAAQLRHKRIRGAAVVRRIIRPCRGGEVGRIRPPRHQDIPLPVNLQRGCPILP